MPITAALVLLISLCRRQVVEDTFAFFHTAFHEACAADAASCVLAHPITDHLAAHVCFDRMDVAQIRSMRCVVMRSMKKLQEKCRGEIQASCIDAAKWRHTSGLVRCLRRVVAPSAATPCARTVQRTPALVDAVGWVCDEDAARLCSGTVNGAASIYTCLRDHSARWSRKLIGIGRPALSSACANVSPVWCKLEKRGAAEVGGELPSMHTPASLNRCIWARDHSKVRRACHHDVLVACSQEHAWGNRVAVHACLQRRRGAGAAAAAAAAKLGAKCAAVLPRLPPPFPSHWHCYASAKRLCADQLRAALSAEVPEAWGRVHACLEAVIEAGTASTLGKSCLHTRIAHNIPASCIELALVSCKAEMVAQRAGKVRECLLAIPTTATAGKERTTCVWKLRQSEVRTECHDDMLRFCAQHLVAHDHVFACLQRQRAVISARCASVLPLHPPPISSHWKCYREAVLHCAAAVAASDHVATETCLGALPSDALSTACKVSAACKLKTSALTCSHTFFFLSLHKRVRTLTRVHFSCHAALGTVCSLAAADHDVDAIIRCLLGVDADKLPPYCKQALLRQQQQWKQILPTVAN